MAGRLGEICPFCGSTHAPQLSVRDENPSRPHVVICRNCGARGPAKELAEHAVDAWNRRASQDSEWIDASVELPPLNTMVEAICQAHMEESRYRNTPIWNAYSTRVLAWRPVAQGKESE